MTQVRCSLTFLFSLKSTVLGHLHAQDTQSCSVVWCKNCQPVVLPSYYVEMRSFLQLCKKETPVDACNVDKKSADPISFSIFCIRRRGKIKQRE